MALGLSTFATACIVLLAGCTGAGHNAQTSENGSAAAQGRKKTVQYTCSMHPEILQDDPGDCPKCGMKLVEKH